MYSTGLSDVAVRWLRTRSIVSACMQLQLVGLSVMDTARKLKEKQQDALYHEFVEAMLPDRGKSGAAVRCGRMRFAIETDVLAKSRKFKALLDKVEAVWLLQDLSSLTASTRVCCGRRGSARLFHTACWPW